MTKIAVVGSLNMDLVIRTPRLPAPGETILGREFTTAPGGKGANQAIAAAKLGASVAMVGRVGSDGFGRTLREGLSADAVDITHVFTDDYAATGVAVIQVDDQGQNTIVVASGANAQVTRADVDKSRAVLTSANALVVQLEVPLNTVAHALQLARGAHVLTILNPAPAQRLDPDMLALADILVPNETEAGFLTGTAASDWGAAEAAAGELHRRGARTVVITLGARGALVFENNMAHQVPPFQVRAVDATAAGDAFVAALAVARASGRDMDTALREASAAGALTATKLGAQPSLPTRKDLDEFLKLRNRE